MDIVHSPGLASATAHRRPHRGRLTRGAGVVVALVLATTLAACSPAPRRIVAVFLDDGEPAVLLHPCAGEPVKGLQVRDVTPAPPTPTGTPVGTASSGSAAATPTSASSAPDLSMLRWDTSSADVPAPSQVRLLTPPDGWRVYTDGDRLLREFREDRIYEVSTSVIGDLGVEFTLGDLERLGSGEVWASPEDTRAPRAMTRDEFARIAEGTCD
jgi:hypothetical protein